MADLKGRDVTIFLPPRRSWATNASGYDMVRPNGQKITDKENLVLTKMISPTVLNREAIRANKGELISQRDEGELSRLIGYMAYPEYIKTRGTIVVVEG